MDNIPMKSLWEKLKKWYQSEDYCTLFFENFPKWNKPSAWWKFWEYWKVVYIGDCCKIHDDSCSFHKFIECLWNSRVVATTWIAIGGTVGCIINFPKVVYKRWF